MKIILCGTTLAGKDTLKNKLVDEYGLTAEVSYTTRSRREGEIDGKDYNFVSFDKFNAMKRLDMFLEHASHPSPEGEKAYYGTTKEDWNTSDITIMNAEGILELNKHIESGVVDPNELLVVFMGLTHIYLRGRIVSREGHHPNLDVSVKKYTQRVGLELSDWGDFLRVRENKLPVSLIITDYGYPHMTIQRNKELPKGVLYSTVSALFNTLMR